MGSVLINYFSEEISLESHPWFSDTGAGKGQSGVQVCGNAQTGMGWAVISQSESSLSPKDFRDADWECHDSCSLVYGSSRC